MTRISPFSIVIFVAFLLILGCSGTQGPASPGLTDQSRISGAPGQPGSDGLTASADGGSQSHQLWGYFLCNYDPETQEIRMVPLREVDTHFNVLGFLEKWPCGACVSVHINGPSDHGSLLVTVNIKHPFKKMNLTGFDVRGIVVLNGGHQYPISGLTIADRPGGDGRLLNADGYTSLYNFSTVALDPTGIQSYIRGKLATPVTPSALVNGYRRFVSVGPSNTRNAFFANDSVPVLYDIVMPSWPSAFGYAIDACWAPPTTKPVTDPITDFPPEANCPEPWKIQITEQSGGLGLNDQGGQTLLKIDVYDRGGKDTHGLPIAECPEIFPGTIAGVWTLDGADFSQYQISITNTELAPVGNYPCLISVEDNENATSPEWIDLTAYQVVDLAVVPWQNLPPTAAAHASATSVVLMEPVYFYDDSTDPNGPADIVKWEWDFSFRAFEGFVIESEEQNPVWQYSDVGPKKVKIRVTDSNGNVGTLQPPIDIAVNYINLPPNAAAHADPLDAQTDTPVSFFDDSTDPDGIVDIVKREWDFTFDPVVGFQVDTEEQNPVHLYDIAGVYEAQLRVTDTLDQTDMLDEPLVINVAQGNYWPTAAAHASSMSIYQGDYVDFTDDSTDPDGNDDIIKWEWDFSYNPVVGLQVESTEQNPTYQFLYDGAFDVQLRVTDTDDNSDMLDEPLTIVVQYKNIPPIAAGHPMYSEVNIGQMFFFIDDSTDPNGPADITAWAWDADYDGVTFTVDGIQQYQNWTYWTEGVYQVMLRVTDSAMNIDMMDEPFEVTVHWVNLPPTAVASVDDETPSVGQTIHFTDESTDPDGPADIIKWEWDFTYDGNLNVESTDQNPSWVYNEPGVMWAMLYVEDTAGNRARLDYVIEINVS